MHKVSCFNKNGQQFVLLWLSTHEVTQKQSTTNLRFYYDYAMFASIIVVHCNLCLPLVYEN